MLLSAAIVASINTDPACRHFSPVRSERPLILINQPALFLRKSGGRAWPASQHDR
jgi:hypothetical protein